MHHITTFLHLSFKNFHVNPNLQDKAINLVKNKINKRQSSTSATSYTMTTATTIEVKARARSASSTSLLSQCFDLPKNDITTSSKAHQRLDEYMNFNVVINEADDILLFWLPDKSKFLTLLSIVQHYYAMPTENTTIERLFSSSKNTTTDKHTSLNTEKINRLLFLQKNLMSFKEVDNKTIVNETTETSTERNNL